MSGQPPTAPVTIRRLRRTDVPGAVRIHEQVLHEEFITRGGRGFLRRYYQAWIGTGVDLSLVACDGRGELVGALLGAVDPAAHYRSMLHHGGAALGLRLISHAAAHPRFGAELVVTRGARYLGGALRVARSRARRRVHQTEDVRADRVGEVTHVLVRSDMHGRGIGRALLDRAADESARAGVSALHLVTPPPLAASGFYERLGWHRTGVIQSRSGEEFVAYELALGAADEERATGVTT